MAMSHMLDFPGNVLLLKVDPESRKCFIMEEQLRATVS